MCPVWRINATEAGIYLPQFPVPSSDSLPPSETLQLLLDLASSKFEAPSSLTLRNRFFLQPLEPLPKLSYASIETRMEENHRLNRRPLEMELDYEFQNSAFWDSSTNQMLLVNGTPPPTGLLGCSPLSTMPLFNSQTDLKLLEDVANHGIRQLHERKLAIMETRLDQPSKLLCIDQVNNLEEELHKRVQALIQL